MFSAEMLAPYFNFISIKKLIVEMNILNNASAQPHLAPSRGFGARPTGECIFERRSTRQFRSKSPGLGLVAIHQRSL